MLDKIKDLYTENIQTQISASSLLPERIQNATQKIIDCLLKGNKIIVCAEGRSYINAQLLVANLLNRYELARPSFPSVLLQLDNAVNAAAMSDHTQETLLQRQFNAISQGGDLLVIFYPLDKPNNMLTQVISSASNKKIEVIALTGGKSEYIQGFLTEQDIEISVPHTKESRIIENHCFILNAICELIDYQLFSQS